MSLLFPLSTCSQGPLWPSRCGRRGCFSETVHRTGSQGVPAPQGAAHGVGAPGASWSVSATSQVLGVVAPLGFLVCPHTSGPVPLCTVASVDCCLCGPLPPWTVAPMDSGPLWTVTSLDCGLCGLLPLWTEASTDSGLCGPSHPWTAASVDCCLRGPWPPRTVASVDRHIRGLQTLWTEASMDSGLRGPSHPWTGASVD